MRVVQPVLRKSAMHDWKIDTRLFTRLFAEIVIWYFLSEGLKVIVTGEL